MNPLWILLIGMAVVVGGVLALRLHAFLALILGAIAVAALTPRENVALSVLRKDAIAIQSINFAGGTVVLKTGARRLAEGTALVTLNALDGPPSELRVVSSSPEEGTTTARIVTVSPKFDLTTSDQVVVTQQFEAAVKASNANIGERVAEGFAGTARDIAILIAMASIVGEALLASGAAERIVASSRRVLGDNRAGLSFLVSGYVLGIPVFFDTVFYLLVPLGKVMRVRTGRDYLLYILCIVAGATMTHSLVPPTPGPLVVASMLNVELWVMIVMGMVVSAFCAAAGYAYAKWANRRWDVPLRASAGLTDEELKLIVDRDERTLPPLWLSLTPILLPVLLIALAAIFDPRTFKPGPSTPGWVSGLLIPLVQTLGEKNLSLTLAAGIGLGMVVMRKRSEGKGAIGKAVTEALGSAGVIILITSAGGAFGFVLRQTDIATAVGQWVPVGQLFLLPIAFLLAVLVRTAQGSATVAMITSAGIVAPLAVGGTLGFHPAYLALAIGCGSKPIMWMNDSGFWIIGKMSGLTEAETLKSATVMMAIMGVVGLVVVMMGAWLLPLT